MQYPPFLSVGKTTLTIKRIAVGSYVDGRWVDGASSDVSIVANVQPFRKWNDLQLLPEGDRTRKTLVVYTKSQLLSSKDGPSGQSGDSFTWTDGRIYEVVQVFPYTIGPLQHYKAICQAREAI